MRGIDRKKILLLALVIVLLFGFWFLNRDRRDTAEPEEIQAEKVETVSGERKQTAEESQEESQGSQTEAGTAGNGEDSVTYDNLEGLYFLNESGTEMMEKLFAAWLREENLTTESARITGVSAVDESLPLEDQTFLFYLVCDNGLNVKGTYESGRFTFERAASLPEEESETSSAPSEEEQQAELDALLEESGEIPESLDPGNAVILNPEALPSGLDPAALQAAVTSYLADQGELRRELNYAGTSGEGYLFTFQNPRVDGKNLLVTAEGSGIKVELR